MPLLGVKRWATTEKLPLIVVENLFTYAPSLVHVFGDIIFSIILVDS